LPGCSWSQDSDAGPREVVSIASFTVHMEGPRCTEATLPSGAGLGQSAPQREGDVTTTILSDEAQRQEATTMMGQRRSSRVKRPSVRVAGPKWFHGSSGVVRAHDL
jgi:hypothetical protein